MITLSIDSSKIRAKLEQLKNIDTKPLMQQIAFDMKKEVDMRFRKCEDPEGNKWPKLSDATIAKRKNGSDKPLHDTGLTSQTIATYSDDVTALVGSNRKVDRAGSVSVAVHNFGAKTGKGRRVTLPQRKFIGFSQKQVTRYTKLSRKYFADKLK